MSSKEGGLGLGLFLSNAAMTQAGGSLEAANNDEGGTTVRLRLPLVRAHGECRMKTLVVEDDPVFSDVLATALRRRGFDVTVALTCEQAAALIAASPPELAVVDLRIGTGLGPDPDPAADPGHARRGRWC